VPRGWGWLGQLRSSPLVEPVGDGFRVNLGRIEQRMVVESLDELRVMLANHDPATRRLFPTAYPDDEKRDAEYRDLVGDELLRGQLDALDTVERTVDGEVLDRDELEAWMRALNGVRLAIGTRLDVSEEEVDDIDLDAPDAHDRLVYYFLTAILGAALSVIGP
jgi:hypothetical protein